MKKDKKHIVILGGGLAGLAAAYELSRSLVKVTVIEKWPEVGGLARTIKVGEFRFDTGPHRWYTKNDTVNDWMLKLLGNEVIKVPRLTRIYFDKNFFFYPIKLKNALFGIGVLNAFLALFDYFAARIKARIFHPALKTMEDGYVNQFGKKLYEIFFKRYSEKLWGVDCHQISVDWVGQRTRGLSILTVVKDALIKSRNVVSLVDEFSYPKKGVGRLAEKLKEGVEKNGGNVILSGEVNKILTKKGQVKGIQYQKNNKTYTLECDECISSIPITDLILRLDTKPDSKTLKSTKKLKYRDEVQVVLFIKRTHITEDTWVYIHPKEISFMRFMEMDNWSDVMSPKGKTSIVFEIACNEGDVIWNKKDKELIRLVSEEFIKEFNLISARDIIGGYVHRVPKEYPVYHVGYKEDVEVLKKHLSQYKNLQLVGRNGTFRYNNMDHSIEMGLYAARNILSGFHKYDIDSVNIEREYLEEKRIENIEDERVEKV